MPALSFHGVNSCGRFKSDLTSSRIQPSLRMDELATRMGGVLDERITAMSAVIERSVRRHLGSLLLGLAHDLEQAKLAGSGAEQLRKSALAFVEQRLGADSLDALRVQGSAPPTFETLLSAALERAGEPCLRAVSASLKEVTADVLALLSSCDPVMLYQRSSSPATPLMSVTASDPGPSPLLQAMPPPLSMLPLPPPMPYGLFDSSAQHESLSFQKHTAAVRSGDEVAVSELSAKQRWEHEGRSEAHLLCVAS